MRILLIEDEAGIADFVRSGLETRGFSVCWEADGRKGHMQALKPDWDAIVLDLMLPGRDGLDILQDLRQRHINTPVLLLTARNELGDRIQGLALGADDYLAKPFFVEELAARLHTVLRRFKGERQSELQVGALRLDRITRSVQLSGREVELTAREFSLLEYLMRSPGEVFSRAQLLEHVWGYDFDPATNVVDVCIKRIRARLAEFTPTDAHGVEPLIEAVRGVGYRFRRID
ncbi:response regulator transcription factor [Inhella gelatinilytica]|uniref:Response regulator transcription factor n=1 Tax=Inhella gelatinilytica TaxID=2795030 RepID=A0A931IXS5_9BURK|nr:response regulator transcription factor [Inhella gelatinilytica]MBH9553857.1 response regulator transcription factor [Inhella gelatinilytica]